MNALRFARALLALVLFGSLLQLPATAGAFLPGMTAQTTRVSVSSAGVESADMSTDPDITPDGRYVAFQSLAANLAAPAAVGGAGVTRGDGGPYFRIFVHDRVLRTTELVSVSSAGIAGNAASSSPSISDDGRYVAFTSSSTNLVSGDTNDCGDIFVRDRVKGTTTRVNLRRVGTDLVQGNAASFDAEISGDGKVVAFTSNATNLVASDTNAWNDVFVREWTVPGTCERVSVSSGEEQADRGSLAPSLSRTGDRVAFTSGATNLVTPDNNGTVSDVFVRNRVATTTSRVSTGASGQANGACYDPVISANGLFVAFTSDASNLHASDTNGGPDVFVRDIGTAFTTTVSLDTGDLPAGGGSGHASISADGRFVAFESSADDIVAGDTNGLPDVFCRDRSEGLTRRVSVADGNVQSTGGSYHPSVTGDGYAVAFQSAAPNLVAQDTNAATDVFVRSEVRYAPLEQDAGGVTFDRWVTGYSDTYSGGGYVYGTWANTVLETEFYGVGVRWMGPKQPNYGRAEVWLDGAYQATVDCYQASPGTLSATLWSSPNLAVGTHTLRIKCLGTKNAASSGTVVVADRFDVLTNGTGPIVARFDEQDWHASFTGTWIKAENPTYFAKGYAYSSWSGTVFRASFFGYKVAWIGPKVNNYGKANVYIDGAYKGTVDCYSSATGWRYKIWESGVLSRGAHYIEIKPTHTKRAASTNYVVVVDALDVKP